MSIIYLIKPNGHNVYKIGETVDLDKRVARIQKRFDTRLYVLSAVSVDSNLRVKIEDRIHRYYERHRIGNDWFVLPAREVRLFSARVRKFESELQESK